MKKKKNKVVIAIVTIALVLATSMIGMMLYIMINVKPTDKFLEGKICNDETAPCEYTEFFISRNDYVDDVIDKLKDAGIIRSASFVKLYNRIFGSDSFCAGNFLLPNRINEHETTLDEIIGYLSDPRNALAQTTRLTLYEGDFLTTYAEDFSESIVLTDHPDASKDEIKQVLLDCWNNESYVRSLMKDYEFLTEEIFNDDTKILLEGYLFPDTYEFYYETTAEEITEKLLDNTLYFYEKYKDEFNSSRFSTHEIFTLASMVQGETGNLEDSYLVAGAFVNRMNNPEYEGTGGKLESSVTSCYASDLTREQCDKYGESFEYTKKEHPYNTYTIEGLPPGPVCAPGENAIVAALNPDTYSGYYFFVANLRDGGTVFARDYYQHLNNIATYYTPYVGE